jgi:hypothetical protein
MEALYLFRVKHDVQNDSELQLAEAELKGLFPFKYLPVRNLVDLFGQEPFQGLLANNLDGDIRLQDVITRLPYPGAIQGYFAEGSLQECWQLFKRLSFFRDFFIVTLGGLTQSVVAALLPGLKVEIPSDMSLAPLRLTPYLQVWNVNNYLWVRIIPIHTFEECSEHAGRIALRPKDVDRMFPMVLNHFASNFSRPFVPSVNVGFKWIEDFIDDRRAPQAYLTHAFFGLRGRFFPRMIRAIMNSLPVTQNDVLLDPFCGVGTLGVEARILGLNSVGVDINPLFTFVSKVKTESLEMDIISLQRQIEWLLDTIQQPYFLSGVEASQATISLSDAMYSEPTVVFPSTLERKIKADSFKTIRRLIGLIDKFDDNNFRDFVKLPLIYAAESMLTKYTPKKIITTYWGYLWRMFYSLYFESKIRKNVFSNTFGKADFITGDVRSLASLILGRVDWIITSPPYGTAVDYVGNDVYSLYLLGLSADHLAIDKNTIGSMKMLPKSSNLEEVELPKCVISPLNQLFRTNPRKARALAAYYENMALAFQQMKEVLKGGSRLVVIIGTEQDFPYDQQKIKLPIAESMKQLGLHCNLDLIEEKVIKLAKNTYGAIFAESILTFGK